MFTTDDVINALKNNTYFNASSICGHCYYSPQKDLNSNVYIEIEAYNDEKNKFECKLSEAINKVINLINDCSFISIVKGDDVIFFYNP